MHTLTSPRSATCPTHLIFLDLITRKRLCERTIKILIMWFSPLTSYLVPLRPKYYQHPIVQHPQLTSLPQCERPSLTPI
jgi:hypothetical protein